MVLGLALELDEVVEPLVAGGRGDEQDGVGVAQPPDELDGQLDPLARHDAGRLHEEQSAFVHAQLAAQLAPNGRRAPRARQAEVEDVGDHR